MITNSELRNLIDEELDAVAGGQVTLEVGRACIIDNPWAGWIYDNFGFCLHPA